MEYLNLSTSEGLIWFFLNTLYHMRVLRSLVTELHFVIDLSHFSTNLCLKICKNHGNHP